jgi:hypothetical protein
MLKRSAKKNHKTTPLKFNKQKVFTLRPNLEFLPYYSLEVLTYGSFNIPGTPGRSVYMLQVVSTVEGYLIWFDLLCLTPLSAIS